MSSAQANNDASHATFVSALLPGDRFAPHITRSEALALVKQLNRTFNICTSRNIQLCKNGITKYILPSASRLAALFKYLVSVSIAAKPRPADYRTPNSGPGLIDFEGLVSAHEAHEYLQTPSSAFKRLHVLFVLHDVLNTVHSWQQSARVPSEFQNINLKITLQDLKTQATRLTYLAASCGEHSADEASSELLELVDEWDGGEVFQREEVESFRTTIASIPNRSWSKVLDEHATETEKKASEERKAIEEAQKWILPHRHSVKDDPDAPWHELPAANGLYMKSVYGFPLRAAAFPKGGYQLGCGGQEADADLQREVSWLHKEMLHCFDDYTSAADVQDIDALGNSVWKDPERPTRNYWGFTYDGIEKAKENRRKFQQSATGYGHVPPSAPSANAMDDVDAAVARAKALASSRGGFDNRGGFGGRGGRGRGVRGGTGWRGSRDGNGFFRGGRGASNY